MLPTLIRKRANMYDSPWDLFREMEQMWNGDEATENRGACGNYPVDIEEDDNHIYVHAEVPGFKRDEIDVTLEKGVLSITAERKAEKTEGRTSHLAQRRFTHVNRRFSLPDTVDENKVDAKLTDGVLHLTLTKREEVKPRKIEVK